MESLRIREIKLKQMLDSFNNWEPNNRVPGEKPLGTGPFLESLGIFRSRKGNSETAIRTFRNWSYNGFSRLEKKNNTWQRFKTWNGLRSRLLRDLWSPKFRRKSFGTFEERVLEQKIYKLSSHVASSREWNLRDISGRWCYGVITQIVRPSRLA